MRIRAVLWTAVFLVAVTPAAARAQSGAGAEPTLDVAQLPIDLNRIHRGLRQSAIREERDGPLRLKYFVDVFGQSPRIELFTTQDNLLSGPVPYGAPTHGQILEVITPKEFRSPVMDFGSVIRWLSDKAKDKK